MTVLPGSPNKHAVYESKHYAGAAIRLCELHRRRNSAASQAIQITCSGWLCFHVCNLITVRDRPRATTVSFVRSLFNDAVSKCRME
jgi:hypothetical protein